MSPSLKLRNTLPCENDLGEGVVWDPRTGTALWTDIEGQALYRSAFPFDTFERIAMPERVGSFGLLEDRTDALVVAFASGFARLELGDGSVHWIDRPELPAGARFNDGRVDRSGVFWAGSMIENPAAAGAARGALYRLTDGRRAEPMVTDIHISNSLCWSPDGSVMYFADTPRDVIWAFDVRDGLPVNQRVFAETTGNAHPDGSTVDADGCLWNAQWGAGQVVRYTPDGRLDLTVELPAPQVSCVAFAGPALDLLLVTSARVELGAAGLAAAPDSGALFVLESPVRGLPEARCRLPG